MEAANFSGPARCKHGNHQGLENQLIVPLRIPRANSERIDRRSRLGGMLNFYERAAA